MHSVKEIEAAVSTLSKDDFILFKEWFDEYEAKIWDMQFEEDVKSGKLNQFANQAISDYHAGKCTKL